LPLRRQVGFVEGLLEVLDGICDARIAGTTNHPDVNPTHHNQEDK
jgi:hypothetical protein